MELTCSMCTGKEPQTWLQVVHNADQSLFLQQLFPYKITDIFYHGKDRLGEKYPLSNLIMVYGMIKEY